MLMCFVFSSLEPKIGVLWPGRDAPLSLGDQRAGELDKDRVAVKIMCSSGLEKWRRGLRVFVNPESLLKSRFAGLVNIPAT